MLVLFHALIVFLGLLPVDFTLPDYYQPASRYWRAVPTESQSVACLPYALAIGGLVILVAGVVLRRRLRSNAV